MGRVVVLAKLPAPRTWAPRIRQAWESSLRAFLETGRLLAEAKAALPHGEFERMVERDLPFGPRMARMLIAVAAHPAIANRKHVSVLPPHVSTLYQLSRLDPKDFDRHLRSGKIRPTMERKEAGGLILRQSRTAKVKRATEQAIGSGVSLWYVDPPWRPSGWDPPYQTMPLTRIRDLRMRPDGRASTDTQYPSVAEASARCSAIGMWAIDELLREAEDIMAAWGFTLLRPRIIWHKGGHSRAGTGALAMHEYLLVGVRGGAAPSWLPPSVITAQRSRKHSEKPEQFRLILQKMFPLLIERTELFARKRVAGWSAWGNETPAE